jgi:hypothetical protein
MRSLLRTFTESAGEIHRLRSLTTTALLIALYVVLSFVSIRLTESNRVSVTFLALGVTGYLFGPVVGFVSGAVCDFLAFVIQPMGPYFPGWTINTALTGMVCGLLFYRKTYMKKRGNAEITERQAGKSSESAQIREGTDHINRTDRLFGRADIFLIVRITIAMIAIGLLINVLLGTFWCAVMYSKGFVYYFVSRGIKNLIQLPINIVLTYIVLKAVSRMRM